MRKTLNILLLLTMCFSGCISQENTNKSSNVSSNLLNSIDSSTSNTLSSSNLTVDSDEKDSNSTSSNGHSSTSSNSSVSSTTSSNNSSSTSSTTSSNNSSSTSSTTSSNNSSSTSSSVEEYVSPIKAVVPQESLIEIQVDGSVLLKLYYYVEGIQPLKASQKKCTYTSSDESVAVIDGQKVVGVAPGEATITITSIVDTSKSCTIDVVVKGVFIDHNITIDEDGDDFTNEYNEETETGSFTTTSKLSKFYTIRGVKSKRWYVETDITIHEVANDDRYPKIGIFTNAYNSTNAETMVTFFLNADIGLNDVWDETANNGEGAMVKGEDNSNWTSFGVCEMGTGGQWAWNAGVTNSTARYQTSAYQVTTPITYETTFKLGVARDNMDFHVYVNGTYAYTYQLSPYLVILYENGESLDSYVGFYQYNSKATFANYKVSDQDDIVNANIPKESFKYCEFMED